jgi:hypothetical protein
MTVGASISAFAFRGARGRPIAEKLAYAAGIAVLILLLSAWIVSAETDRPPYVHDDIPWSILGLADVFAVWLLGLGAFVIGPAVVAATVAGERRAGTLDQLRTTPLTPLQLAAGMFVGAPARLYLLLLGPLAIHVAAGITGAISLEALLQTILALALGGLTSAVIGLCVALAPKQEGGGAFVALGVAALLGAAATTASSMACDPTSVRWAFLHPAGAMQAAMLQHDGLWRRLFVSSWRIERFSDGGFSLWLSLAPVLSVVMSLAVGGLLLRAACRRLAAPHRPLLSKPQAVLLFSLAAAGIILPIPVESHPYSSEYTLIAFVCGLFLLPVAATLTTLATPTFEVWALSLRNLKRPRWWQDDAAPHVAFVLMAAVYVAALAVKLPGFPSVMLHRELYAFAWAMGLALTLPVYALFGSTRYPTGPARFAYAAAVFAHMIYQVIIIAVFATEHGMAFSSPAGVFVELGVLLSVAVPAWVLFRQHRLAEGMRGGLSS